MTPIMLTRFIALVALGLSTSLRADPGDFGAMPGLWKIVTQPATGKPSTQWQCVDEGADPWATFAAWASAAGGSCSTGAQQRSSTALAWNLTCDRRTTQVRLVFDSATHYTATLARRDGTLHIAGERLAACTSPTD